jgi:hypothetical protein
MSDDRLTSRRAFAIGAGFVATAAAAGARAAPPALRQNELVTLSNTLYGSPAQRAAFIADPKGFAARLGVRNVSANELAALKNVFADGFCCHGCGCNTPPGGTTVERPQ